MRAKTGLSSRSTARTLVVDGNRASSTKTRQVRINTPIKEKENRPGIEKQSNKKHIHTLKIPNLSQFIEKRPTQFQSAKSDSSASKSVSELEER